MKRKDSFPTQITLSNHFFAISLIEAHLQKKLDTQLVILFEKGAQTIGQIQQNVQIGNKGTVQYFNQSNLIKFRIINDKYMQYQLSEYRSELTADEGQIHEWVQTSKFSLKEVWERYLKDRKNANEQKLYKYEEKVKFNDIILNCMIYIAPKEKEINRVMGLSTGSKEFREESQKQSSAAGKSVSAKQFGRQDIKEDELKLETNKYIYFHKIQESIDEDDTKNLARTNSEPKLSSCNEAEAIMSPSKTYQQDNDAVLTSFSNKKEQNKPLQSKEQPSIINQLPTAQICVKRSKIKILIFVIFLIFLVFGGIKLFQSSKKKKQKPNKAKTTKKKQNL